MGIRAVVFDFNGTLSHDEPILCEIFMELFAEHGKPLSAQAYFDQLAGLSDPEIVRTWLGADHPAVDEVIEERVRRYRLAVADGSSIPEEIRDAVRYTAGHVPVGIASGAARAEIEPVLESAGIAETIAVIVAAEDVEQGKPAPDGYERAASLLGFGGQDVLALEDTEAGVASAKDAGLRCVAVLGTLSPARLMRADEIVERIDVALMERLLA
jgi:beta-phosphoglucomutase